MTKMSRSLGFALALGMSAAPGFAQTAADKEGGNGADKVICRRETPIGSLIATRKVCLTKAQWDQRAIRGNEAARRMVEDNAARNPYLNN